jgi:2-iminobutanoate/2-iminopropanoate deaminase
MVEKISLGGLPVGGREPLLSTAVRWGNLLFLSGRAAVNPETLEVRSDDFEQQARFVLDEIVDVLRTGGSGPEHVLRVECWLANATDFADWNRIYAEYFPAPRPARTTLVSDFAVPGLLIEVQVTAGIPGAEH